MTKRLTVVFISSLGFSMNFPRNLIYFIIAHIRLKM